MRRLFGLNELLTVTVIVTFFVSSCQKKETENESKLTSIPTSANSLTAANELSEEAGEAAAQ